MTAIEPKASHTTGTITVVESMGRTPTYYLLGPSVPPLIGEPNNGPVIATVPLSNPNALGDARLWARAGRLKECLAVLVRDETTLDDCRKAIQDGQALLAELD